MSCNRREKIILARVEKRHVRGGARRDHPHDFAADQLFARAGLLHLIANRDFEAAADQARDVAFRGVIGNATHRDGLALFPVTRGERDLQFARGNHRIFVKKFVEIAEAEKQQRMRVARLNGVILLHQRCCRLAHS